MRKMAAYWMMFFAGFFALHMVGAAESPAPLFVIENAQFGANEAWANVTEKLNASVKNNTLSVYVASETFGGDPAPGVAKTLKMTILYKEKKVEIVSKEWAHLEVTIAMLEQKLKQP